MFYTYIHRQANDNSIFYVGKGVNKRAWDKSARGKHWKNIYAKHGLIVEICAEWETEQEAFEHEKFLIFCLKSMGIKIINFTDGGEGASGRVNPIETKIKMSVAAVGRKHSETTKARMSASHSGENNEMYGKPITEEHRKKLSASRTGDKNPRGFAGRKHTPEARAKMIAARKKKLQLD